MKIERLVWLRHIVDKLVIKHTVETYEVEEVFANSPKIRYAQEGDREGENVYLALGQSDAGRYLVVFFIYKLSQEALILSARDMEEKERRQYGRK